MKYKTKLIHVKGCHDCPFHNNEWCNLGAGNVVNEWRAETYGAKCPLVIVGNITVSNNNVNSENDSYDIVEKPEHYANGNIECWDAFCSAAPIEQQIGAFRFNVFKYLWRLGKKDGHTALEDAQKAEQYLRKLIELLKQT